MKEKNYNIIELHNNIISTFENEKQNISKYKTQYEILINTNSDHLSPKYKQEIEKSRKDLAELINNIDNNINYEYFILETVDIINKYKELLNKPMKVSFFGTSKENKYDNIEKERLLQEYILIAKAHIDIDISGEDDEEEMVCSNCGDADFHILDNEYTCKHCGMVEEVLNTTSCLKDIDRINISVKYTYDRQLHFKEMCKIIFKASIHLLNPKCLKILKNLFKIMI